MALGDIAAGLGLPCFPCNDKKRPVTESGFKAATRDRRTILDAFSKPSAALIGVPTGEVSGIVVVDIDIRDDRSGMDWLTAHASDLPPTRTHRTRSGGLHLLFRYPTGHDIRNSAGKIATCVDVRGNGGYVVYPPSPGYQVADPAEPAEMPPWLIAACGKPYAAQAPTVPAERTPPRQDGGSRYGLAALERECEAIRCARFGEQETTLGGAALKIGALVAGGELNEDIALGDLKAAGRQMPSEAGREPWVDANVAEHIRVAFKKGMGNPRKAPPGRQRPTASAEPPDYMTFDAGYYDSIGAEMLQEATLEPDATPDRSAPQGQAAPGERAKPNNPLPLLWFDDIVPVLDARDFVQGLLLEQGAVVIYGESNAGKTFWATDLALHVAAGDPWCKRRVEQGGVVYCVLEGGIGFRNRVSAWKIKRGLEQHPIPFAAIPSGLNLLNPEADTPRLIDAIKTAGETMGVPVKLVVIDTLSRAMAGGNENAPEDMGSLVMNMDTIRTETGACVMFIHHSGKDQAKGARGHSSLRAAIDTEIEVAASDGEAKSATVVKQREMKKGDVFPFTLQVVELGTNRHTEPVTTCLVDYGSDEQAAGAAQSGHRRLTGHNKRALEVLVDLVASSGRTGDAGVPSGCCSVPEKWWRDGFYDGAMPGATAEAKTKAFNRVTTALINEHHVGMGSSRVWVVSRRKTQPDILPDISVADIK